MALEDDKLPQGGNDTATPADKKPPAPAIDKDATKGERSEAELNAALSKAFRKAEAEGRHDDDDGGDDAPKAKAKPAAKKPDDVAGERERGPDGKFKAKEGDAEEGKDAPKKPAPKAKESEAAESDEDDSADEKASKPGQERTRSAEPREGDSDDEPEPESWREKRDLWKGMSREARQHVSAREKAHTETAKHLDAYKPVGLILNAHQHTFARHGVSFDQGLAMVLRAQEALDNDPPTAIRKIAESYGIDLRKLVGAQEQHADPAAEIDEAFDNPQVRALQERIDRMERAEAERIQRFQLEQVERQRAGNISTVTAFEARTDKYPHAAAVRQDIIDILPGLMRANPGLQGEALLAKAYEKAVKINDGVRAKIEAAAKAKADAEAQTRKAAERARDADALNVGDDHQNRLPERNVDDELRKVFRRRKAA